MTALARSIHARASRVPARQFVSDFEVPNGLLAAATPSKRRIDDVDSVYGIKRCHYCGETLLAFGDVGFSEEKNRDRRMTRDHTVPQCDGGEEWVRCCTMCNRIKGSDPYEIYVAFMRWPDARDPRTRKAAYRRFRVEIIRIGLAAFEEEVARMTGGRRDG